MFSCQSLLEFLGIYTEQYLVAKNKAQRRNCMPPESLTVYMYKEFKLKIKERYNLKEPHFPKSSWSSKRFLTNISTSTYYFHVFV